MLYSNTNKSDIENIDKTMTLKKNLKTLKTGPRYKKITNWCNIDDGGAGYDNDVRCVDGERGGRKSWVDRGGKGLRWGTVDLW